MRLLLDTNIFISVEPTSIQDLEISSDLAAKVLQLAHELGSRILLHPAQKLDIEKDKEEDRKELRKRLFGKYATIDFIPSSGDFFSKVFGTPQENSNDWIDLQLLVAMDCEAADLLISEDVRLRKRAARVGLGQKVISLNEAVEALKSQLPKQAETLPSVKPLKGYGLDRKDPIFESLRRDYGSDAFEEWLGKCAREERQCWVLEGVNKGGYLGVTIVDPQSFTNVELEEPTLKICTFKISEKWRGSRLGELLLRAIFEHMVLNEYRSCFVTLFPKQKELLRFLLKFGFFEVKAPVDEFDEVIMAKNLKSGHMPQGAWKEFIQFGPSIVPSFSNSSFVVPIQGPFHDALFPEKASEQDMFQTGRPFSNAINKAYLCRASTRQMQRGDLLRFYRSGDHRSICRLGIVEDTLCSENASDLRRFLNTRTVYPKAMIEDHCSKGEALGILFRLILVDFEPIADQTLFRSKILNGPPQSITRVSPQCQTWLINRILSP